VNLQALRDQFSEYHTVLEPDRDLPEWWAGAPSVCVDREGVFWMACRMREGDSPRGLRGYEIRLLRSADGLSFEPVHSILREQVPIPGFERPALLYHRDTDSFSLFGCGPFDGGPWCILRFDDATEPTAFSPGSCRPVIRPQPRPEDPKLQANHVNGTKDPFVFRIGATWHCFVIAVDRVERTAHLVSEDGEAWRPVGQGPALDLGGWHSFFTRPASVLPIGPGYLLIYEGSHVSWFDPTYNVATGLAWTPDLLQFTDLTPHEPLFVSTTPGDYRTWRYSHWLWFGEALYVYAEVSRPNNSNEIRAWKLCRPF